MITPLKKLGVFCRIRAIRSSCRAVVSAANAVSICSSGVVSAAALAALEASGSASGAALASRL
jgi:hypothetical protein